MSIDPIELSSTDVAVLDSLQGAKGAISQRQLARQTGLSVGLINAVIKKLVQKGYVKTSHLNRRQFEYLLTPDGFARTAVRSYHYMVDTIRMYQEIQENLKSVIGRLLAEGVCDFYLCGDGELAELVALFHAQDGRGRLIKGLPERKWGRKAAILNATSVPIEGRGWRVVDLVHELKNGSESGKWIPPAGFGADPSASLGAGPEEGDV